MTAWLETWAPYLSHFHLHNNDGFGTNGTADRHKQLPDGTITLELMEAGLSVRRLLDEA